MRRRLEIEQVRQVAEAAVQAAQLSATLVQSVVAAQPQPSEPSQLQGKDLVKLLKQPFRFEAATRNAELSGWRAWSWELEQWLGAIDMQCTSELEIATRVKMPPSMADMAANRKHRSRLLHNLLS